VNGIDHLSSALAVVVQGVLVGNVIQSLGITEVNGIEHLDDVLAYERARVQTNLDGQVRFIPFPYDPRQLFAALAEGRMPTNLTAGRFELEIHPGD
jgi:hypothetical protein